MTVIGLHIPKTAGMGFIQHLYTHLLPTEVWQTSNAVSSYFQNNFIGWQDIRWPAKLKIIYGHHVHEEIIKYFAHDCYLFCCLRQPVDRLESQFFFDRELARRYNGVPPDMDQFLQQNRDPVCRYIARRFPSAFSASNTDLVDRVVAILKLFDSVIPYDRFAEGIRPVCELLGISSEIPRANEREPGLSLSADDKAKFRRNCEKDQEVFERVSTHFRAAGEAMADRAVLRSHRIEALGRRFREDVLMKFLAEYVFVDFRNYFDKLSVYREWRTRQKDLIERELLALDEIERQ